MASGQAADYPLLFLFKCGVDTTCVPAAPGAPWAGDWPALFTERSRQAPTVVAALAWRSGSWRVQVTNGAGIRQRNRSLRICSPHDLDSLTGRVDVGCRPSVVGLSCVAWAACWGVALVGAGCVRRFERAFFTRPSGVAGQQRRGSCGGVEVDIGDVCTRAGLVCPNGIVGWRRARRLCGRRHRRRASGSAAPGTVRLAPGRQQNRLDGEGDGGRRLGVVVDGSARFALLRRRCGCHDFGGGWLGQRWRSGALVGSGLAETSAVLRCPWPGTASTGAAGDRRSSAVVATGLPGG